MPVVKEATQVLAELVIFFFSKESFLREIFLPDRLLMFKAFSDVASGDSNNVVF